MLNKIGMILAQTTLQPIANEQQQSAARGRPIGVRPNWKEQPPQASLTGKVWR
jgi:hypothetical protein